MNELTKPTPQSQARLSRRSFLKMGCLGVAAVGATVCGIGAAIPGPKTAPVDQPSFSFEGESTNQQVLIVYASHAGSTAEVAAEIGKVLGERGFCVNIRPAKENPPVAGYAAVLIGSAVHYGQWLAEAVDYVKANQAPLRELPVTFFTVHMTHLEDTAENRQYCRSVVDPIRSLVQPAAEVDFAGKFDRRGAALLLPGAIANLMPSMDMRNWGSIRAWAEELPVG